MKVPATALASGLAFISVDPGVRVRTPSAEREYKLELLPYMNDQRVLLPCASPVTQSVAAPALELSTLCDVIKGASLSIPFV